MPVSSLKSRPGYPSRLSLFALLFARFVCRAERHRGKELCGASFRAARHDPFCRFRIHAAPVHERDDPCPVLRPEVAGPERACHSAQFVHISALFIVIHEAELQANSIGLGNTRCADENFTVLERIGRDSKILACRARDLQCKRQIRHLLQRNLIRRLDRIHHAVASIGNARCVAVVLRVLEENPVVIPIDGHNAVSVFHRVNPLFTALCVDGDCLFHIHVCGPQMGQIRELGQVSCIIRPYGFIHQGRCVQRRKVLRHPVLLDLYPEKGPYIILTLGVDVRIALPVLIQVAIVIGSVLQRQHCAPIGASHDRIRDHATVIFRHRLQEALFKAHYGKPFFHGS